MKTFNQFIAELSSSTLSSYIKGRLRAPSSNNMADFHNKAKAIGKVRKNNGVETKKPVTTDSGESAYYASKKSGGYTGD